MPTRSNTLGHFLHSSILLCICLLLFSGDADALVRGRFGTNRITMLSPVEATLMGGCTWGTTRLASSIYEWSASPVSRTCEESTITEEVRGLHLGDRVAVIKAQNDLSDAIITYRSTGTNSFESAARTRRVVYSRRAAFSNAQAIVHPAAQQQLAAATAHLLNANIALTRVLPLNLPPEHIPYPFHSFW